MSEYLREQLSGDYCLVTGGRCIHYPINILPNSFFVAEPYDDERGEREKAIKDALYGYKVNIADENAFNISLTCKVCQDIQRSEFGVVDITRFNHNALIELGMLYGYNKPTIILLKKNVKVRIKIPSNIIGIEQVRYLDYTDLSSKLRDVLKKLFELRKRKEQFVIKLEPILRKYLRQIEIALKTKELQKRGVECSIIDFKIIGEQPIAIVDKGEDKQLSENIFFKIYRCDQKVGDEFLEEEVGEMILFHIQSKITQGITFPIDPLNDFWVKAYTQNRPTRNIARPFVKDSILNQMSEDELTNTANVLKQIIGNIKQELT